MEGRFVYVELLVLRSVSEKSNLNKSLNQKSSRDWSGLSIHCINTAISWQPLVLQPNIEFSH